MSNERKPLLNSDEAKKYGVIANDVVFLDGYTKGLADYWNAVDQQIAQGKLRVVEHASPVHKLSGLLCSICSISWQDDQYCRGCGNKIKR